MNNEKAVNLLSILGSDLRLPIFRMLIQAGDKGLNPKYIADKLDIKPNKFHRMHSLSDSVILRLSNLELLLDKETILLHELPL